MAGAGRSPGQTPTPAAAGAATIGYEGYMRTQDGGLRLSYSVTAHGTEHKAGCWIDLVTTPQPFGGRRWWFVCPKTAKRVSKVYMPPGAVTFASRGAHRLAYKSQRGDFPSPARVAAPSRPAVAWATTRASAPPSRSHQACAGGRLIASWRKSRPLKAWPRELAGRGAYEGDWRAGSCVMSDPPEEDDIIAFLKAGGVPVTREAYLEVYFMGEVPESCRRADACGS